MPKEFTAQIAVRRGCGRWRLYVALLNTTAPWPERMFNRTVPTFTQRTEALSALGYEPVPDATWTWEEHGETHGDPSSPVFLFASIRVRSRAGVVA
ncbi:DUF6303 family protein [Streptomyces tropicalis]|uniref:DUF6303 family protein n=1 Tax=Streptomyces tropicalis TaxID=3034234 RepID=A0ABT6A5R1_9ACTN|nr:DUF6303 family protein [Streptomyces tropicalis]MDF3299987.1 DUF6303 family protein [Streptomyces tropicalis]